MYKGISIVSYYISIPHYNKAPRLKWFRTIKFITIHKLSLQHLAWNSRIFLPPLISKDIFLIIPFQSPLSALLIRCIFGSPLMHLSTYSRCMILCSCISLAERSIELIRVPISGGNKAIIFFTSDTSAVIRLHFVSNVRNSDNKTLYKCLFIQWMLFFLFIKKSFVILKEMYKRLYEIIRFN